MISVIVPDDNAEAYLMHLTASFIFAARCISALKKKGFQINEQNSFVKLGDGTSIGEAVSTVSDAKLEIGEDCMLSKGIVFRTHDSHHIFDKVTHQRINVPKNVVIGDHVWIGYEAHLLAGTRVGRGSVVGARAVTSSSFGDHVV